MAGGARARAMPPKAKPGAKGKAAGKAAAKPAAAPATPPPEVAPALSVPEAEVGVEEVPEEAWAELAECEDAARARVAASTAAGQPPPTPLAPATRSPPPGLNDPVHPGGRGHVALVVHAQKARGPRTLGRAREKC